MSDYRSRRIETDEHSIREAILIELISNNWDETDAATCAYNIVKRLTAEPPPSSISGLLEDDDPVTIVTNTANDELTAEIWTDEGWKEFRKRRIPGMPGYGNRHGRST